MADKKNGLMVALELGKGKPPMHKGPMGPEMDEDEDYDMDSEYESFASDLFDAVQSGDKEAFAAALRGAIESC